MIIYFSAQPWLNPGEETLCAKYTCILLRIKYLIYKGIATIVAL